PARSRWRNQPGASELECQTAAGLHRPHGDHHIMTQAAINPVSWERQNQDYLTDAFSALAARLGANDGSKVGPEPVAGSFEIESSPAIDRLTAIFGLSNFERELLLLLAGVEMDPELSEKCAQITGQP